VSALTAVDRFRRPTPGATPATSILSQLLGVAPPVTHAAPSWQATLCSFQILFPVVFSLDVHNILGEIGEDVLAHAGLDLCFFTFSVCTYSLSPSPSMSSLVLFFWVKNT
jgi:hypothetical protein